MHLETAHASNAAETGLSESRQGTFDFLRLPRELRDVIYNYTFDIDDHRSERGLRIERRNLKYFKSSAAAILLVLHHEYFLLNRQVAREALEVLFKDHTVFLSCGPFVLRALFQKIDEQNGPGRQWLRWIKKIELDWVTFPTLTHYPPDREGGRDTWYWEQDTQEVDVDYIRGAAYNGHYDEHDHEGNFYDDNFYDPFDSGLYPSFDQQSNTNTSNDPNDPFGFATHYPFAAEAPNPTSSSQEDITTKLSLLIQMEVVPLFTYLASPTFALSSITLPLYFISAQMHQLRSTTRPGYALPLKIRYWVSVCAHALLMLAPPAPTLQRVVVRYMPWDIWASMDPVDNLPRMAERGVWFDAEDADVGGERESEGEAFRGVWNYLADMGVWKEAEGERMGLRADVRFVQWDGNVDSWRVGDELEVVFTRA